MSEQEAVRQPEGRTRLQRLEDARVELRLRGVGDEQDHQVRLRDDVEHLSQRLVVLAEVGCPGLLERRRSGAQADGDLDGLAQRVAEVLRLRAPLRPPTDDADPAHPAQRRRQKRQQVPAAPYDPLSAVGEVDQLLVEDAGLEV